MDDQELANSNINAIARRMETMALSLASLIAQGRDDMIEKLETLVHAWMLAEAILLHRVYNILRAELVKRMQFDTGLRAHIRKSIGETKIRRWWQKYRGTYEQVFRPFNGRARVRVSQYIWAKYKLRPVPNYNEPARTRTKAYAPYVDALERPERPYTFSFYAWELDGQEEPVHQSASIGQAGQAVDQGVGQNTNTQDRGGYHQLTIQNHEARARGSPV